MEALGRSLNVPSCLGSGVQGSGLQDQPFKALGRVRVPVGEGKQSISQKAVGKHF